MIKTDFADLSEGEAPPDYYNSAHWLGWTAVRDNLDPADTAKGPSENSRLPPQ